MTGLSGLNVVDWMELSSLFSVDAELEVTLGVILARQYLTLSEQLLKASRSKVQ